MLRNSLLQTLVIVNEQPLKSKISDIIGNLAGFIISPEKDWPEILSFTYQSIQSSNPQECEIGLYLIGMLSHQMANLFCSDQYLSTMQNIFRQYLVDLSDDLKITLTALKSFVTLITNVQQESDWDHFQSIMDFVIVGLFNILGSVRSITEQSAQDNPKIMTACAFVETLIEFASECPNFFGPKLRNLFETVVSLIERKDTHTSIKYLLIELLVTISENIPKKVRKLSGQFSTKGLFVNRLFPILSQMMITMPEDPNWYTSENNEDFSEVNIECETGESSLYRICQSLGLRATWNTISTQISSLLSSNIWQHIHAGLRQLGNYAEVTTKITSKEQLSEHRKDFVLTCTRFSQHAHPRVRDACFYAIGQFFISHGNTTSMELLSSLIPVMLLGSNANMNPYPRVRQQAVLSLVNFIDHVPTDLLDLNIDILLSHLSSLLRDGSLLEQEPCITAITSIAESVKSAKIATYYDVIMPMLKNLLSYYHSIGREHLWALTLECCAMLGEACGSEKFRDDANAMMGLLSSMQVHQKKYNQEGGNNQILNGEDIQNRKLMMKVWVRIAYVITFLLSST